MDSMQEKYDSALLAILQHEGKIEKFLDVVFGFLRRRHFYLYSFFGNLAVTRQTHVATNQSNILESF